MHKLNQLQLPHAKHGTYSNYIVHSLFQSQNMPILSQLQLFQRMGAQSELIATISNETCIF